VTGWIRAAVEPAACAESVPIVQFAPTVHPVAPAAKSPFVTRFDPVVAVEVEAVMKALAVGG